MIPEPRTLKPAVCPIHAARWIWCDAGTDQPNRYALFRRTVELPESTGPVRLFACADMRYWLYVNGRRVGFGPAKYDWREPRYDTHDISTFIGPGRNVVAFKVHGMGPATGCSSFMPVRCALIAAIAWQGGAVMSDRRWRALPDRAYRADTPRFCNHQSYIECYDARERIAAWELPDFDDSGWSDAYELPTDALAPWERLIPRGVAHLTLQPRLPVRILDRGRAVPPSDIDVDDLVRGAERLQASERLPADAVAATGPDFPLTLDAPPDRCEGAYAMIDFGENAAGYLWLDVEGTPGTRVDLGYSESLDHGRNECYKQRVRYHDRVILGSERFRHQLLFPKCLRYLLIEVHGGRATLHSLGQEVSTYPVQWRGGFRAEGDPLLGHVWRLGAYTVQLCMEDVYLDTPRRERAGWLGDMLPQALAAYHAFGDTELARHSLELFMRSQTDAGWIAGRYPGLNLGNMPVWSACFTPALADYCRYSGNLEPVRTLWPGIQRLIDWFEAQRGLDDLMRIEPARADSGERGYILVDWAPMERDGAIASMNLFYVHALREAAWLADAIGERAESERLRALERRTVEAIRTHLFDATRGVFVNCIDHGVRSRQAGSQENLLALLWNVATPDQAAGIVETLLPDDAPLPLWHNPDPNNWNALGSGRIRWEGEGLVPIGSPFFSHFALGALFEIGRATAALNNIRAHHGRLAATGATTLWEEWSGVSSQSHGWGAGPTALLPRYVLGIEPLTPGFATFGVFPAPGDLRSAAGRVPTPAGDIQVEWEIRADRMHLTLCVPEGLRAVAGLPADFARNGLRCDGSPCSPEPRRLRRGVYAACALGAGTHTLETNVSACRVSSV